MKDLLISLVKRILASYTTHFPIKINNYWFYMSPNNIEIIPAMLDGKYEIGITKLIHRIVKNNWIICDVGAYIGYHTTLFSKLSGKLGKVISVEPQPNNYKLLLKNVALNKLKNIFPINMAMSNKTVSGKIYIPSVDFSDSRIYKIRGENQNVSKIKLETLDNILKNEIKVDLIKIDIQGWEEKAIIGARKTILRNPELILIIEFWPKGLKEAGTNPIKLLRTIKKLGFNIYKINEHDGNLEMVANLYQILNESDAENGVFINLMCSRLRRITLAPRQPVR